MCRVGVTPFVSHRSEALAAADLIAILGDDAQAHAAAQARSSRASGNLWHFCRWRQIERLIDLLNNPTMQTLH
jgi:hypothetical protein